MAENQLPLDPERRKEKEFFEELYPREEPETTRSSMTPRGNRKPVGSGGSEKERQYKRRSKKRRFPKILESRSMEESYARENIGDEGDLAVEEAINSTERGTRERADALLDAARKKKDLQNRLNNDIEGRGVQAFAGELGVGLAADILLPLPDPISRGLNFGIGYGTNVLAQMWRTGEFSYDKGEALAAGGFQAIPFGTAAKGLKGITRAAVKSGTGAVVGEQVRVGIDERRALTPEEVGTAFVTGGALGGTFKGAIEGGGALSYKLTNAIDGYRHGLAYGMGGTGGAYSTGGKSIRYVPPTSDDTYKVLKDIFHYHGTKSIVYGKDRKFNWTAFHNSLTADQKRSVAIWWSTVPHSKIGSSWKTHRESLVKGFEAIYGDAMVKQNISSSDIDVDHIYTLVQSMRIYDDLPYNSPLWNKIQKKIISRSYDPGNAERNLLALDPFTHQQKTNFFNALHGEDGKGFFTDQKVARMKKDDNYRLEVLDDYLDQVDEGSKILKEGQKIWRTLHTKDQLMPEEIVRELSDIVVGPKGEMRKYTSSKLRSIIAEIMLEGDRRLKQAIKTGKTPRVKSRKQRRKDFELMLKRLAKSEGISETDAQGNLLGFDDDIMKD